MAIAVRNVNDGEWKKILSRVKLENAAVQELIHDFPELISVEDLGDNGSNIVVCIRNPFKNGSESNSGLIGIDDNGMITIVECRIANDPNVRKEVVGQAMEYAANLWEMTYEDFDELVKKSEGNYLVQLMGQRISAERWSADEFIESVKAVLRQGKFRFIMTVQGLNDELRRTIKFLNARGPFAFETYAVEIQHFNDGQTEIIVPRVVNFAEVKDGTPRPFQDVDLAGVPDPKPKDITAAHNFAEPSIGSQERRVAPSNPEPTFPDPIEPEPPTLERNEQKEKSFFAKCQENASDGKLEVIKRLYDFSIQTADHIIWWGSGGASAFNYVLTEVELTVFIVDASGKIMFNFSEWHREPSCKELLPQFLEKLKSIGILRRQKEDYTRWPDFNIEQFFAQPEDFNRFEQSVKFLKEELAKLALV